MKTKFMLLSIVFLLITSTGFAQKNEPQSIISGKVSISKYHDRDELDRMQKGQLLDLYNERIEVIVKILPNIAFATKPGITMTSLGIPDTKENRKALEDNIQASKTYFDSTIEFQKRVLPYSDKLNLIAAILFYEETLKALHTYNEFN
ncbi:MAG TPA: hypothetical protein VKZ98_08640 [Aquaticitalea sp.]|nr:hypothetical protein [Aquaticitalea sp.]